ncbi:protein unc-93 homolog A-like [Gigantopelta aegis]|uniref:protein unc-93 homolog A-like n=1 Tax=Gigantopelta aegis TaxID=1735272 RepID=UPI001B88A313|nr:protein unc-93 homolog A-like [Gigantopelta aegis]
MMEQTDLLKGKEVKNVVVLSLSFLLVFTSYTAIQNLQSSLNQAENLGIISLSVIYGLFILSGIMAPVIIGFIGVKKVFLVAWMAHIFYTASNFYPSFYTLLPASVLLGAVSGFLWTAQNTYLSICAISKSTPSGSSLYSVLSRMNSIFFVIFQCTQITGNVTASLVLQQETDNSTEKGIQWCGPSDCPSSAGNSTTIAVPQMRVVYILLGTYLVCTVIGLLATLLFLDSIPTSVYTSGTQLKVSMTSCGNILFRSRLTFLIPLFLYQSTHLTVIWTDFTKSFVSCPLGIRMVGFVMATYGGSTVLFTFIFGYLAKYCGRVLLFTLAATVNAGSLVYMYVWHPTSDDSLVIFVVAAVWGMAEGVWETQIIALVALLLPDNKEAAFANLQTWKGIGFTLTFVYGTFLCVHVKLLIAIVLLVLGMTLYYGVEIQLKLRTRGADIDKHVTQNSENINGIMFTVQSVIKHEN